MKEAIQFYYNLYPDVVTEFNGDYYFSYEDSIYYFKRYYYDPNIMESIHHIQYLGTFVPMHIFVLNKDKHYLTPLGNALYALYKLRVNMYQYINIPEILSFIQIPVMKEEKLLKNNWVELWSEKIDYFEYQMNQFGKKHKLLYESFPYFVGLAENAISYIKNTEMDHSQREEDQLVFSHRRLRYNDTHLYLYDFTNIIIDHPVRNIAEYVKSLHINGYDGLKVLEYFLMSQKLSPYGAQMLFGRLMFPTFYFDLYQDIIEGYVNDDEIIQIISKVEEFEKFLNDAYQLINAHIHIKSVRWIEKRVIDNYNSLY